MKHITIPWVIGIAFVLLLIGGQGLQSRPLLPPDTVLVAQAGQSTLTAWPTVPPMIAADTHLAESTATPVAASPTPTATLSPPPWSDTDALEHKVVQLINERRQTLGLHTLALATELTAAARRHSQDMATQAQPQHQGSDGSTAAERIRAAGYWATRTSETFDFGDASPEAVVNRWMEDDGHRNVLLSNQFSELGVGYVAQASGPLQDFWTVDFGQRDPVDFQPARYNVPTVEAPAIATTTPTFDPPKAGVLLGPIRDGCPTVSEHAYATIPMEAVDTSHPDTLHGDLNLALRGYAATPALAQLIDLTGPTDPDAPRLTHLFADRRTPDVVATYQVNDWQWGCGGAGCRGERLTDPAVTLLGLATRPGEPIYVPARDAEIYGGDYIAVVLYAYDTRITLAYTRDGTVAHGYAIQLENVCVDPNLLAAYRQANTAGRSHLPALQNSDLIGIAATTELLVATRDRGAFLDPRSRKDWWR